jgi:hypothetical protein
MENVFLGFVIGGTLFSALSLFAGNLKMFFVLASVTVVLFILFLIFGGYRRIQNYFKIQELMKKFPRDTATIGYKQAAELLGFSIEYLQGLSLGFGGPNIAPKAYTRDVSLAEKSFYTKAEIRQLAYYKFSDVELSPSKATKADFLER